MSERTRSPDTVEKPTWEVGLHPAGDPDRWSHYHPTATDAVAARKRAKEIAAEDGLRAPVVYMCAGPYGGNESEPVTATESEIKDTFPEAFEELDS